MRLLLVEDDKKIAASLTKGLVAENFIVDVAHDSDSADVLLASNQYDLLICDWMIPGKKDGVLLCEHLRSQNKQFPIIMLSAKSTIGNTITGLAAGADDYLTKPFSFDELLARIRALLRRRPQLLLDRQVVEDLVIDRSSREVQRAGKTLQLTTTEYLLLEHLAAANNAVVTKDFLLRNLWDDDVRPLPNTLEAFINRLRKKIDTPFPQRAPLLHTKRGFGYRLGR
jgi:DNA-binding response OmpR family regulator